jgi:hypothetical protein
MFGRIADLAPPGVGVLFLRGRGRSCRTDVWPLDDSTQRRALACDARLERCTLGAVVYRFEVRGGRRQLVAVIQHARAAPPRESVRDEEAIAARDRICELHDRLARGDRTLASDDLWTLVPPYPTYEPPSHACGVDARRASLRAISAMGGPELPLVPAVDRRRMEERCPRR